MAKTPSKDLLSEIRAQLKEEGRTAIVFPDNVDIGQAVLPKTITVLTDKPTQEAIPISAESAQKSYKGSDGYRKTPEGLAWDVMSFHVIEDGIEKRLSVDITQRSLLEQMIQAWEVTQEEGKPVRVTIEMRASRQNPGQRYKGVRVLGTETGASK